MANLIAFATAGRGTATEAFFGGVRMQQQIASLTGPEAAMLANAITGAGRLNLQLRIIGMIQHPFPQQQHPHAVTPHLCYIVQLPDPNDIGNTDASGPSTLYITTTNVAVDPHHFPQRAAPAVNAATVVATTPTPFVMDNKFIPNVTEPTAWAAEAERALELNHYGPASETLRVEQVLSNVSDDTASGLIAIFGARTMSANALLALIIATHPLARSGATQRAKIMRRIATDGESLPDFMNKLLADYIKTFGSSTLAGVLANRDADAAKAWVQDAAAAIIYAVPPRHRQAITASAERWVNETETQAQLVALMSKMNSLDATAALFNKPIQGAGVYAVATITDKPTSNDGMAALRTEITQLRAEAAKAKGKHGRPPIDFSKPWTAKFGLCNTCAHDPQSVSPSGAREHWRKDCPLR
jgi:hypothetical protein